MLLSLLLAVLILLPHAGWIASNWDLVSSSSHKLDIETPFSLWGLADLGKAVLLFMAPLLLAVALTWRKPPEGFALPQDQAFLWRLLTISVLLLTVFVLLSGTNNVKNRWLQPLLFFMPLAVATLPGIRVRPYVSMAIVLCLMVGLTLPGRTLLAGWSGKTSRPNLPYANIALELRQEVGDPGLIICDRELVCGNMRLEFTGSRVEVARGPAQMSALLVNAVGQKVLVLSEGEDKTGWFEKQSIASSPIGTYFRVSESPLLFVPDKTLRLRWLVIQKNS
jgi:hypothetical protein